LNTKLVVGLGAGDVMLGNAVVELQRLLIGEVAGSIPVAGALGVDIELEQCEHNVINKKG
jgi:hypothetical protein